jgi:hypothetical protein
MTRVAADGPTGLTAPGASPQARPEGRAAGAQQTD